MSYEALQERIDRLEKAAYEARSKPHGHVIPSPVTARCGGPALCRHCLLEEIHPLIAQLRIYRQATTIESDAWKSTEERRALQQVADVLVDGLAEDCTFIDIAANAIAAYEDAHEKDYGGMVRRIEVLERRMDQADLGSEKLGANQ